MSDCHTRQEGSGGKEEKEQEAQDFMPTTIIIEFFWGLHKGYNGVFNLKIQEIIYAQWPLG